MVLKTGIFLEIQNWERRETPPSSTMETFIDLFGKLICPICCKKDYLIHIRRTSVKHRQPTDANTDAQFFSNLVAHILFCNRLDKSIDQHNLAIFPPIFGGIPPKLLLFGPQGVLFRKVYRNVL